MLLTNVGVNLLVIPAGILFLSFSKWYVVGDTAISGVSFRILLSHVERDTNWERCNTARPIKLDVPGANVLFGFLDCISRIPSRLGRNATRSDEGQYENARDLHLTRQ